MKWLDAKQNLKATLEEAVTVALRRAREDWMKLSDASSPRMVRTIPASPYRAFLWAIARNSTKTWMQTPTFAREPPMR